MRDEGRRPRPDRGGSARHSRVRLDASNTAIVLDSTADYPEGVERFPNWRIVPLYVNLGGTSYRDYVDLAPDELYAQLASAPEPPTTSQPSPGDFLAVYEELLPRYERVLSLQLSSTLSGTYASAAAAAADAGRGGAGDRHAHGRRGDRDARARGAAAARAGHERRGDRRAGPALSAQTHGLLFTLETLEFLARGGRIGRAQAFAGTLLNVKPVLGLEDGEVVPLKRVRGSAKALDELVRAARRRRRPTRRRCRIGARARGGAGAARGARAARPRGAAAGDGRGRGHDRRGRRHARRPRDGRRSSGSTTTTAGDGGHRDRRRPRRRSDGRAGSCGPGTGPARSGSGWRSTRCPGSGRRPRSGSRGSAWRRSTTCSSAGRGATRRAVDEVAISELWGDGEVAIAGVVRSVRLKRPRGRLRS